MRAKLLIILLCFLPMAGFAQGFAGLGQSADGFALPRPAPEFSFPADHGAHPDYRIEWWYLTASLQDASGQEFGVQWTLFRSGLAPGGPQIWMGHAGLTTQNAHHSGERFARGGIGQAGVDAGGFLAWIDDWEMAGSGDALENLRVRARMLEARYELTLSAEAPLVFHGREGYSIKSETGHASYYYSQPFYRVSGTLHLPEGPVEVTGQGWLDREWSSQPLGPNQKGWDWFSLHFEGGARLMGFGLRSDAGVFTYASWITPEGELRAHDTLSLTPLGMADVEGREVPVRWRVQLPQEGLDIEVNAVNADSWQDTLFPYWEGPVLARGSHTGRGYLEMTGYE